MQKFYLNKWMMAAATAALMVSGGCRITSGTVTTDLSNTYSGNGGATLSLANLNHLNDSLSRISIDVNLNNYNDVAKTRTARTVLNIEVFRKAKTPVLTADTVFAISDSAFAAGNTQCNWIFGAATGKEYLIKATFAGGAFRDEVSLVTDLDKRTAHSGPWFSLLFDNDEIVPSNISNSTRPVKIASSRHQNGLISVKYFSRNFEIPLPPFSLDERSKFDYLPDSIFQLAFINDTSAAFSPKRSGLYFFTTDTSAWQGTTLLVTGEGFPKIVSYQKMTECLRYITNSKEFRQLTENRSPKMAVDSFWIANTGSADIATSMIRRYYSRVEDANRLFTSFTEGWKTDRGMIYIVFGKPAQVFRDLDREVWVYGEQASPSALKFFFDKVQNPFTTNDFVLERRDFYRSVWYQNVQAWRR